MRIPGNSPASVGRINCHSHRFLENKNIYIMLLRTIFVSASVIVALEFFAGRNPAEAAPGTFATKINFSGHLWEVKSSTTPVGPGPNWFSDSKGNVWVDDEGKLHLKVSQTEGRWRCAEIISEDSFGLGTYRFQISTPLATFDPNLILGLYTWSDTSDYANREIDIECSKWGKTDDTNNAQFVVQPYPPIDRRRRFCVPEKLEKATYSFSWHTNNVQFSCLQGETGAAATNNLIIQEWNFNNGAIPLPGDENVRMNLWLYKGKTPMDVHDAEIVISKFEFLPDGTRPDAKNQP
jgi:hypothetical protein